jgi:hypothetical protein
MRPQSRPFVVEIKRSKKSPAAPAETRAPESPVALDWPEATSRGFSEASPARQAAEALFGQIARPAATSAVEALDGEPSSPVVPPLPVRRVLFAIEPAALPVQAVPQADGRTAETKARKARSRRPVEVVAPVALAPKPAVPRPVPVLSLETPEDQPDLVADGPGSTPRRSSSRYGRKSAELARGERWKRRLPAVCR